MKKSIWFLKEKPIDGVIAYGNLGMGLAPWRKQRIKFFGWRDELGRLWSDEIHLIWMVDPKDKL